jgi:putative transposase
MAVSFKGAHVPAEILLTGVRWSVADPLRTRQVEERLRERGVEVDHSPINRWVVKDSPQPEEAVPRHTRSVGHSWRLAETYSQVTGHWYDLDRAGDKTGQPLDFLLTELRAERAAKRFLTQALRRHGVPETSTIAGSKANDAAIKSDNQEHGTSSDLRQINYLHNSIEPDHRGVKRVTRPLVGCQAVKAAQSTLLGMELMQMLRKGQWAEGVEQGLTPAEPCDALAS